MRSTEHIIITLDGPGGVGKTTLAQGLAEKLGIPYLDTGAMFRAAAWMLGQSALDMEEQALRSSLLPLRFELKGSGKNSYLLLQGEVIGDQVRTEEMGFLASSLAKTEAVRNTLKEAQRLLGRDTSLVAEGRDMGSVVFPEAGCKFYLQASPEIRAERRYKQLKEMGRDADMQNLLEQIQQRDFQDQNRELAPLRPAPDAVHLDTGHLTPEEILDRMVAMVKSMEVSR